MRCMCGKCHGQQRCYNCGSGPFHKDADTCSNCRAPKKYQDRYMAGLK